jgi:hypothetical protein
MRHRILIRRRSSSTAEKQKAIGMLQSALVVHALDTDSAEHNSAPSHRLLVAKLVLLGLLGCFFCVCACQLIVRQIYIDRRRTLPEHADTTISTIAPRGTYR